MNNPVHRQRLNDAFCSTNPSDELFHLAISLRDEGVQQITLYSLFSSLQVATPGDDPRYDAIVDTMDLIYGGPWAKGNALFPTELTDDQIREHRNEA